MKTINLNHIPTEYIMRTKAGNLWRCGKGFRKDWNKLIGKLVLLHNTPYTLINRIKEAGKWYLVFTDGTNNYTERQDKALHNKKLAKDTIIEAAKRVIAGLLPAPMELIDQLVQQVKQITLDYNKNNLKLFTLCPKSNKLFDKIQFIAYYTYFIDIQLYKQYKNKILMYYHPDRNFSTDTDFMETLYWIFNK